MKAFFRIRGGVGNPAGNAAPAVVGFSATGRRNGSEPWVKPEDAAVGPAAAAIGRRAGTTTVRSMPEPDCAEKIDDD